jgi:hypothetical protein
VLRSLTPNAALEAVQTHRIFTAIVDPSSALTDAPSCALREGDIPFIFYTTLTQHALNDRDGIVDSEPTSADTVVQALSALMHACRDVSARKPHRLTLHLNWNLGGTNVPH